MYVLFCRAAMVTPFLAIGRSGEAGLASYDLACWDTVLECLYIEWQELKTCQQKPMNFFPDYEYFELDYYHSMACYFVTGAGSGGGGGSRVSKDRWIFPFLW
jgi:hypothetical protein